MNAETSDEIAIHWFRRDLRLADNSALAAAAAKGTVVPVVVLDPETEALGSASRWRLGLALEHLAESLEKAGSRLVLRRGRAEEALPALVRETGATSLHWQRLPEPPWQARDRRVASALGRTAMNPLERDAGPVGVGNVEAQEIDHALVEECRLAVRGQLPEVARGPWWRRAARVRARACTAPRRPAFGHHVEGGAVTVCD